MGVKFVTSLTDPGQPYSCDSWQSSFGNSEAPLVIDENQSSTGLFSLLHDSWNAFPTFAIIDHTMTVRVKPWTLDSNSNSNGFLRVAKKGGQNHFFRYNFANIPNRKLGNVSYESYIYPLF